MAAGHCEVSWGCVILFINRYMRPEGHGSGLPLPYGQRQLFTYTHFLAQIRITDHGRAPTGLMGVCWMEMGTG